MPAVQCMCTGNAIITFFTPFNPTHVTRNVAQNTRPSFRFSEEGSGDETRVHHVPFPVRDVVMVPGLKSESGLGTRLTALLMQTQFTKWKLLNNERSLIISLMYLDTLDDRKRQQNTPTDVMHDQAPPIRSPSAYRYGTYVLLFIVACSHCWFLVFCQFCSWTTIVNTLHK